MACPPCRTRIPGHDQAHATLSSQPLDLNGAATFHNHNGGSQHARVTRSSSASSCFRQLEVDAITTPGQLRPSGCFDLRGWNELTFLFPIGETGYQHCDRIKGV